MARHFEEHIKSAGLSINEKTVTNVMAMGSSFMVLADNEMYEAKTLILAMGVMATKLLEGEESLLGRGVSYCATCDGMLYKGKKIAVVTNDPKYEHEVKYLSELAEKVYYFPTFKESQVEEENVILSKDMPVKINGEGRVSSLTLRSGEELLVDGIFCLRNAIAPSTLVPGLEVEDGHILVDRAQVTNLPGCFAAGDCTGRPYQYTKAVGEGNVAAHSCIKFLSESEK
jgi:thioredoxin reductase (NADPH)